MRLAPEGIPTLAVVGLVWIASLLLAYRFGGWLIVPAVLTTGLFLLVTYFFRDPDRPSSDEPRWILSPADGKVVQISEVREDLYMHEDAVQISIFLSPLDVHVNRVPSIGRIELVRYHPGLKLLAWDERASSMNERADFGLVHPSGRKLLFRQITGFLARRISYDLREGDTVRAGDRFGIMKFGSRMDVVVPRDVLIDIKVGDRVVAGITRIARWPSD